MPALNVIPRASVPFADAVTPRERPGNGQHVIVHIVERFAPGGIETMVADIVEASDDKQFIISLSGSMERLASDWTRARSLNGQLLALDRKPAADLRLIGRVAQQLRTVSASAVVAHHIGPLLYGGLGSRLAGITNLTYVEHDGWHYQQFPKHRRIFEFCDRLLRPKLAAVSPPVAKRLQTLGRRNVTLLPPGVSTDQFRPRAKAEARKRFSLAADAKLIGCVGRLEAVKGHADLVKAIIDLPDDTFVVLAGDGSERSALEALARTIGVRERICFSGSVMTSALFIQRSTCWCCHP